MDLPPPPPPVAEEAPADEDATTPPVVLVAEDGSPIMEIVVEGERPITAASALTADARDIELRPLTRPGDVAEVMPGLFAVQHAGGGKANQYFIRGFDADHGTDVALSVDGVPVNMVSHAHGQGYADLHFLIPELVSYVDVRKGPYEVFDGDLATAGAIDMHLIDSVDESYVQGTYGSFGTARGLAVVGAHNDMGSGVLAAEVYATDGPFDNPEDLTRFNGFAKGTTELGPARLSVGGLAYGSGWHASGQIPLRAVDAGDLSYWGSVDPSEGGQSTRRQAWADLVVPGDDNTLRASAWLGTYALNLYSNFTFFAVDPDSGDQIEQVDRRRFSGFDVAWWNHQSLGQFEFATRVGAQGRFDAAETWLYQDLERERLSATVDAALEEGRIGAYVREEVSWKDTIRLVGGARIDHFTFAVEDRLEVLGDGTSTSGVADAALVSPKANLIVSPLDWLDLFANWGFGFHSNDARGVVRAVEPVDPLTRAMGYEAGLRLRHERLGQVAVAAYALDMDAETVWVGDEGTTELRGPTHRQGVDVSLRAEPLSWLFADADMTLASATYTQNAGNADAVALAPTFTLAGGVGVAHPSGVSGGVRVRSIGDRPATEDGSLVAEGWTILDAELGYRWRALEATLQVNNVLDTEWKEVQFANESRLATEAEPVEDIHFTPGWPRTILATAKVSF